MTNILLVTVGLSGDESGRKEDDCGVPHLLLCYNTWRPAGGVRVTVNGLTRQPINSQKNISHDAGPPRGNP